MMKKTPEHGRILQADTGIAPWKFWGPYLSDRQWGTVREDYSAGGDAWNYFTHDMARSRAYRWGEDGLAGFSDEGCHICLSVALWNGQDPILKERLFGLTNGEGNHGEDVKELYYYLDATPTHSYLKMLYKYPQRAYPYARLVEENRRRDKRQPEFELLDTGIFDDDRYFDVFIEYAKGAPHDVLLRVSAHNRGPDDATIHLLPQIWFRDTWSWKESPGAIPTIALLGDSALDVRHPDVGRYRLWADERPEFLFCDNNTNTCRLFGDTAATGYFKDAFHEYLIDRRPRAINPTKIGTKSAAHYVRTIPAGGSIEIRLRLSPLTDSAPLVDFDACFAQRRAEADAFYAVVHAGLSDPDACLVQRQALAGMIWNRQFYNFDVREWLAGDPAQPAPPPERKHGRNADWGHLNNREIISMPDKWEYPWYAAWDLAFHCLPLSLIDPEFAKGQLILLTREWYMHPNGQLPAYEWNFSNVNPPVHAWAAWRVFQIDRKQRGDGGDLPFLERVFHKLMLNFTWWVNRKDADDRNIFQGGFLGLDNIGVFDRSAPLPMGGMINQADATSWMAMYCLNLMRIALELALHNPVYQDIASKFFEHFLNIAAALTNIGSDGNCIGLWDEEDGFYYNSLQPPSGRPISLKVRSLVGLIPLFAVETLEPQLLERVPEFHARLEWLLTHRPDLASLVSSWHESGLGDRRLLSLFRGDRLKRLLTHMLDETEFLSDFGIRALSRYHADHPYTFLCGGQSLTVSYQPGESDSNLFGGNSNWRGPIWMPVNYLIIESLQKFHHYHGDDFKIECPTRSGRYLSLEAVAEELTARLARLFLRDLSGRRPLFGDHPKLQQDPHFRDYLPFPEYFDGERGRGVGAAHQTGWTGLIAKLLKPRRRDPGPNHVVAPSIPAADPPVL
jgi:hypothetical protein